VAGRRVLLACGRDIRGLHHEQGGNCGVNQGLQHFFVLHSIPRDCFDEGTLYQQIFMHNIKMHGLRLRRKSSGYILLF
jgi:hypothetical protein